MTIVLSYHEPYLPRLEVSSSEFVGLYAGPDKGVGAVSMIVAFGIVAFIDQDSSSRLAYIPMSPWRDQMAQVTQNLGPLDHLGAQCHVMGVAQRG